MNNDGKKYHCIKNSFEGVCNSHNTLVMKEGDTPW